MFYKNLLGLNEYTSNVSVFGELGKFTLHFFCKERLLNFWLKNDYEQKLYPICFVYGSITRYKGQKL